MEEDKRRIYELMQLVDSQKEKIKKQGRQLRVAHRQRLRKIPAVTIIIELLGRIKTYIKRILRV